MRTLKLVLTENNGEVNECKVPILHTAQKEITDAEIKAAVHGKNFDLMTEIKKLSDKLDVMQQDGPTACSCGSNDVKYDYRDEITVCQSCGTYW